MLCALGTPAPEPGIYPDIPFHTYDCWQAVSNSKLSLLKRSPRHYRDGLSSESTNNQRLCELYHCGILEPEAFGKRYVVQPQFHNDPMNATASGEASTSRGTKFVKDKEAAFAAAHCDQVVIERQDYEDMIGLVMQYAANPDAHRILNGNGHVELSIVWDEEIVHDDGEVTTIRCKARLDRVSTDHKIIADAKATVDIERFGFAIGKYSYHRQLAHYVRGWEVVTGESYAPWIIAHEKTAPFTVLAAPLGIDEIYEGREERERLLRTLAECLRTDIWPGMASPGQWTMPSFFFSPTTLHGGNQTLEV